MSNLTNKAIPADIRSQINRRLASAARDDGVRLLLAIESGSRAWGFPSPDSDYDVRFIYVRPKRDYLSLFAIRDVIEQPIVDEIDLNGWDIRKALGLLLKNNSVVSEWIESPISYTDRNPVMADLAEIGDRFFNPRSYALHYANLGKSSAKKWLENEAQVPIKKLFYALRPALAIRALRLNPDQRPPMQLQALMSITALPRSVTELIEELVAKKAETREAGLIQSLPELDQLILSELDLAEGVPERPASDAFIKQVNELFLELVDP